MKNFKLLLNRRNSEGLYSRRLEGLDNHNYYGLIREEMYKGNSQFIITNDIMRHIISKYVLDFKYDLISIETDEREANIQLKEYISKMNEDRGYLAKVYGVLRPVNYINSITLKKYDEIMTIKSKGVVTTNTIVSQELLNTIWNYYNSGWKL